MLGIIEFKKEDHAKNLHLLHKLKYVVEELIENMEKDKFDERNRPMYRKEEYNRFNERDGQYAMKEGNHYREGQYNADIIMDGRYRY